jgi:hypothetical protein
MDAPIQTREGIWPQLCYRVSRAQQFFLLGLSVTVTRSDLSGPMAVGFPKRFGISPAGHAAASTKRVNPGHSWALSRPLGLAPDSAASMQLLIPLLLFFVVFLGTRIAANVSCKIYGVNLGSW